MRLTGVLFYAIALPLTYTGFRRRGPVLSMAKWKSPLVAN